MAVHTISIQMATEPTLKITNMKNLFLFLFLATCSTGFSQKFKEFTRMELVTALERTNFVPVTEGLSKQKLKAYLLQIPNEDLQQLNINVWYLQKNQYVECYELYKMYYTSRVSKELYDTYNKELVALMNLDGVVKSPQ